LLQDKYPFYNYRQHEHIRYVVYDSGDIVVENKVTVAEDLPFMMRFGMQAQIPGTYTITWYGRGPEESCAAGRKSATRPIRDGAVGRIKKAAAATRAGAPCRTGNISLTAGKYTIINSVSVPWMAKPIARLLRTRHCLRYNRQEYGKIKFGINTFTKG
jgi:hypothetical protein